MKIVSNNFYFLEDDTLLILSLRIGTNQIPVGSQINFFVDNESIGEKLTITTLKNIIEYDIIGDANDLQQVYNLRMKPTGLVSNIMTFVDSSQLVYSPTDLKFITSTIFKDYDFWFSRQELKLKIPNNETVDRIEEIYSDNIKQYSFQITALQNSQELVIFTEPNAVINLSSNGSIQFKIFTNGNTFTTEEISVIPGDESLSECIVSGTFFEGDSIISESTMQNNNMNIVLTLRFETWIDDIITIKSELSNIITSQTFYAADPVHFQTSRPSPINTLGASTLISNANVTRTSEQIITITFDRNINIIHPETISIQSLPSHLIRSALTNIPVIVPHAKLLIPSPGKLEVITDDGDIISEKDFWTGSTRITLRANDDVWQDTTLLTQTAYQSFCDHIRSSITSDSPEWTTFIQSVDFVLSTSGSDLFLDIPQQTSNDFNITSVIETSISVDLLTSSGLPTRLSNNNLLNQNALLIVNPVESFIMIDRDLITEDELWTSDIRIKFRLLDGIFIADSNAILSSLRSQFDQSFPSNQISQNTSIENFGEESFVFVIPNATPITFNINVDTPLTLEFAPQFLRNGTSIYSPQINFVTTQVLSNMTGTESLSVQNVIQGFSFVIELTNNSWKQTTTNSLHISCRSDEASGWNKNVTTTLTHESDSKLRVTVQPTPIYNIFSVEIIDVYILKDGTYNQKLHYVGNFTIQGSSLVERNHHDYNKSIQRLISEVNKVKRNIHNIKLSITPSSQLEFETAGDFDINDTIYQRLMKMNSSEMEHPISVCRPPLINGNESSFIQTLITNSLLQLKNFNIPKGFDPPLCVPILYPDFATQSTDSIYTILLTRSLPISVTLNGATTNFPPSQVHTLTVLHTHHDLSIFGDGIQTTSLNRSTS
uniref:Uncharacterized protein n=1 Tax=viral metagenome TaxID=1070528 RepID=A0A6C0IZT7_9ZZZZ